MKRRATRLIFLLLAGVCFFVLFVLPVGGSFLITNSRFRSPERGATEPGAVGLSVSEIDFAASDGVQLRGWWDPGEVTRPVIVFVHGLNRSHLELVERAGESRNRGFGVFLFDLRSHGDSGDAYRTLGINESRDLCAAAAVIDTLSPNRRKVFWGVSLGAVTSILAATRCDPPAAIVADSAFVSLRSTVADHIKLIFGLPAFPVADLLLFVTRTRMGFDLDDGNVEHSVSELPQVPILFIAGSADVRMPPERSERLRAASVNPGSRILVVEGATHGRAFAQNPSLYLDTVYRFLNTRVPE